MQLTGIISISGKPGLSKIVSQTRTGLIVESILDGKRAAVHGAERVSSLEDISIYTYEEDMLLSEVFTLMLKAAEKKQILSHKSTADELKNYLLSILPNYDQERVYISDIKKLVQWYNLLLDKGLLKEEKKEKKTEEAKTKSAPKAKKATTKKAAKSSPKSNAGKPSGKAASSNKSSAKASTKGK